MDDVLSIITSLLAGTIRVSIPIAFAALAARCPSAAASSTWYAEGMMLLGAFFGVVGSYIFGNPWMGLLVAVVAGALTGLLHALLTIQFKCEHVLSGVGISVLAGGLTVVLLQMIWQTKGKSTEVASFSMLDLPGINQIPYIKDVTRVSPLLILLILCAVGVWFLFVPNSVWFACARDR